MSEQFILTCSKVDISVEGSLIVALLNEYSKDEMGGNEELPNYVKENLVNELSKRNYCHVFICRVNDIPAGITICFEGFSTFACKPLINFHDIMVLPKFRRIGVCKKVIETVETYAKSIGCCKLTLEVLEGNFPAISTYKSVGFEAYELSPTLGKAMFWQKKLHY